jgi:hypothetical protein
MAVESFLNAGNFVAGINHDGFAGFQIAQNRAITGQHSHWDNFVYAPLVHGDQYSNRAAVTGARRQAFISVHQTIPASGKKRGLALDGQRSFCGTTE